MSPYPDHPPAPLPLKSDSIADIADHVFMRRVLRLPGSDKESIYDFKLTQEATELGLTVSPPPVPTPPSHHRRPSIARDGRSISTDSFASKSSRPTSEFSKSWDRTSTGFNSLQSYNRRSSATSSSSRSRDSVLSQPIPIVKQSRNSSVPPTVPRLGRQSPESPQPSSPHKHLIRGLTKLRLRRHDSDKSSQGYVRKHWDLLSKASADMDRCPHCPESSTTGQPGPHRLPCGHGYCTGALRNLVEATYTRDPKTWPTCCGQRIPKSYLDLVRARRDSTSAGSPNPSWTEMRRHHSESGSRNSTTPEPIETVRESSESDEATTQDRIAIASINLSKALRIPEYALLRTRHTQQRNRLLRWDAKHRTGLVAASDRRRKDVSQEFDRLHDELVEKVCFWSPG